MSLFSVSFEAPKPRKAATKLTDYEWAGAIPFILVHILPFGAFFTGTKWQDWAVCVALYWLRMFGVTGFYHRYFSHRTFKTSRVMQFLMAFWAQTSSQRGAVWWAAEHRTHHKFSDLDGDPHDSRRGFWYSHMGWIFDYNGETDYRKVRDLAKYPELILLNKLWYVPPTVLGVVIYLTMGASGLFIAFGLSTVLLWHGTFTINSLSHMFGSQRFDAKDASRNNFWLALVTMGEGWHNNHHYYMTSTRQGFFWWEVDVTYYMLTMMSWLGLVWDLREPPAKVYADAKLGFGNTSSSSLELVDVVHNVPAPGPAE
ncbi:MAG: acyl-CoA desaturase [Polyangiaceae bacterium]|nr:acyl-CoA desaturase [Polyangiaceae bacterium]